MPDGFNIIKLELEADDVIPEMKVSDLLADIKEIADGMLCKAKALTV